MLILTRKPGEIIRIGDNILIKVIRIKGMQVRLGVIAPDAVAVHRAEIYDKIKAVEGCVTAQSRTEYLLEKARIEAAAQYRPVKKGEG